MEAEEEVEENIPFMAEVMTKAENILDKGYIIEIEGHYAFRVRSRDYRNSMGVIQKTRQL